MNTIKVITVFICTLFCVAASAQAPHLYNVSRTFNESGFTYRAEVMPGGTVRLFNAANRHDFRQIQTFRDGRRITTEDRRGFGSVVNPCTSTIIQTVNDIVRNALSPAERQRVGDWQLMVIMYVNMAATTPQPIAEVKFGFNNISPFATIPVSVYRQIELEIKQQVRMMPTASGRQLNFVSVGFPVRVN